MRYTVVSGSSDTRRDCPPRRREHLTALTGLRFLAALFVVLFHWQTTWHPGLLTTHGGLVGFAAQTERRFIEKGYVGVSVFFILSGFILAYTYLDNAGHLRGGRRAFWGARIARIYPVYALGIVVAAVPTLVWHQVPPIPGCAGQSLTAAGIAAATLTQAWSPCLATLWNGPGWSLSVEALFYALFPLIAVRVARLGMRSLYAVAVGSWCVALAIPTCFMVLSPGGLGRNWLPPLSPALYVTLYNPLARLPEFLLGVAVGCIFMRRVARQGDEVDTQPGIGAIVVVSSLLIVGLLAFGRHYPYPLLHDGLLDPLFAALIYGLASRHGGVVERVLSLPVMVALGEASYALYILHYPLWAWFDRAVRYLHAGHSTALAYVPIYLACAVGLSLVVYRYVETPTRRAIRARFGLRPTPTERPVSVEDIVPAIAR